MNGLLISHRPRKTGVCLWLMFVHLYFQLRASQTRRFSARFNHCTSAREWHGCFSADGFGYFSRFNSIRSAFDSPFLFSARQ